VRVNVRPVNAVKAQVAGYLKQSARTKRQFGKQGSGQELPCEACNSIPLAAPTTNNALLPDHP